MTVIYISAIVVGTALGTAVFYREARRSGAPLAVLVGAQVLVAGAAFAGARFWAFIERGGLSAAGAAAEGMRYPGGLLGIGLALLFLRLIAARASVFVPAIADAVALSIPLAFAPIRVGCFLQGCCFGRLSELPWAVSFPVGTTAWQVQRLDGIIGPQATTSLSVHPLQLYFGLWLVAVVLFLYWFRARQSYAGQLALVYLALHELGKWALEFLRYQAAPPVQVVSGALGLAAALALLLIAWRKSAVADTIAPLQSAP